MDSLPRETRLGIRLYVVPAYHGGKKATRPDVEMKTRWKWLLRGQAWLHMARFPALSVRFFFPLIIFRLVCTPNN
jgi:hypothetical protein